MPSKGWISLHRKITEHWVWKTNKPFDKRSAWIDILLMVNHRKRKVVLGNELIEVDAGERVTSERKLAERWGWSRTKVRNFLKLLQNDNMIKVKKPNQKRTRLKVVNYSKYQDLENRKKTREKPEKNQKKTTGEPRENTNNNDNNDNNDNKKHIDYKFKIQKIYKSLPNNWEQLFKAYIDIYRQKNKTKKITDSKHHRLLSELYNIFQKMQFDFDGKTYELNQKTFKYGIDTIIKKEIDNLNYAKKVWINQLQKTQKRSKKYAAQDKQKELYDLDKLKAKGWNQ